MWLKALGSGAILLFVIWLVAVLQGWSKNTFSGRVISLAFLVAFGGAAAWGMRTLTGLFRWKTMLPNAFIGKPNPPTDAELNAALGDAKAFWDQLIATLVEQLSLDGKEWNSYSRRAGWALRLQYRRRNIVYLSPCQGCFAASFALGDKAVAAARADKLPKSVVQIIDEAKRYAEGTAVRIEVRAAEDVAVVRKLAAIKLAN
jgi:ketosteroid isomerase-like protein